MSDDQRNGKHSAEVMLSHFLNVEADALDQAVAGLDPDRDDIMGRLQAQRAQSAEQPTPGASHSVRGGETGLTTIDLREFWWDEFCAMLSDPNCQLIGMVAEAMDKNNIRIRSFIDKENAKLKREIKALKAAQKKQAAPLEITAWKLDVKRYVATPMLSDGRFGAPLNIRKFLAQYHEETSP